ncbi:hypothetical protein Hanom_Chr09g00789321 [Helianthus anomalus]
MRMNGWIHQRFKRSLVLFYMVYPLILILPRERNGCIGSSIQTRFAKHPFYRFAQVKTGWLREGLLCWLVLAAVVSSCQLPWWHQHRLVVTLLAPK